jgi:hypothetical protein
LLFRDRPLLATVALWGLTSAIVLYGDNVLSLIGSG